MADLKYFNALINSVVGNDEERKAAKEYLAEVDPETWSEQLQAQARNYCGVFHRLTDELWITLDFVRFITKAATRRGGATTCRWLRL